MYYDRNRQNPQTTRPIITNLTPFGWISLRGWFVLVILAVLLLIGMVFALPAFSEHPHSNIARLYQHSLDWATLGHNAPLSHFPQATALSYLAALGFGVVLGFLILITRIQLDVRRLIQCWRVDFTVLLAAISLAGVAVLASVLFDLPFTDRHFLSLQSHSEGWLNHLLLFSLQSRFGLLMVSLLLLSCSLCITLLSVLAPCLSGQAARHDLLVDD